MSNLVQLNKLIQNTDDKSKDVLKLINSIVDEMSFVETDKFICSETSLGDAVGEGVVSGFATISDCQVGIFATNPAVLKGSIGKKNAAKITRMIDNSVQTSAPIIGVIDTSGARLGEGIEVLDGYASILKAFARAYGQVPTIVIVKGNNFGMLSYLCGICDACIAYDKAVIASSSPLIIASKTKIDSAKVGTASVHSAKTGIVSLNVKNDKELKTAVTGVLGMLTNPLIDSTDDGNRVAKALSRSSKIKDIIAEIFDKGSFIELKAEFAAEAVTGYARLNGIAVGVVACNKEVEGGKLTTKGSIKIAEFITSCGSFSLPIVNLVDCSGVINNLGEESDGLIREVANLIYSYNMVDSVKVSLIVGNAVGLGYVAFASHQVCDYSIAWADSSINPIESLAAANLFYSEEIAKVKDKDKDKVAAALAKTYDAENSNAVVVAQSGAIDNVIDPNLSRQYLIMAVQTFISKR